MDNVNTSGSNGEDSDLDSNEGDSINGSDDDGDERDSNVSVI